MKYVYFLFVLVVLLFIMQVVELMFFGQVVYYNDKIVIDFQVVVDIVVSLWIDLW